MYTKLACIHCIVCIILILENGILVMFSNNRRGALVKWKQHQGPGATYRKLIMAFEEAHRLDLADVVDRLAGKVTSDQAKETSDCPIKGIVL